MGKVRVELDNVRKENETVRGENARLTQRITANFEEMQRANAILTERAKMAEMRVKQVEERETEGRVRLERARLREEGLSDSMFSPGGTGRGLGGDAQLFDRVVAELQREVEEGRGRRNGWISFCNVSFHGRTAVGSGERRRSYSHT